MDNPIYDYLRRLIVEYNISDFYFRAGTPLAVRLDGEIRILADIVITESHLADFFIRELDSKSHDIFIETNDIDFAITIDNCRFRVSGYHTDCGWAMVARPITNNIPDIETLGLPSVIHQMLRISNGLILVTGPTGSGKSTSLAAMIDQLNRENAYHIITIEDPIEFVHTPQMSIISQREVGSDTDSFAAALRGALRQNPDIIMLGELRDYETISLALTAAETGHLVFGTLHTSGAAETINRVLDAFPPEQQSQARAQLSQSLQFVLTQKLLKSTRGGRIGAFEVMVCVPAIRNIIRENKIEQINAIIQTGAQHGMITMEKYLDTLAANDLI